METLASGVTALGGASTTWTLSTELQSLEKSRKINCHKSPSLWVILWYSTPHLEYRFGMAGLECFLASVHIEG